MDQERAVLTIIVLLGLGMAIATIVATVAERARHAAETNLAAHREGEAALRERLNGSWESIDQWKEAASEWKKLYLEARDEIKKLNTQVLFIPGVNGAPNTIKPVDDIPDPPSVAESDRAAVDERRRLADRKKRPLDSGHVPVSTQDPDRQPAHQARESEAL